MYHKPRIEPIIWPNEDAGNEYKLYEAVIIEGKEPIIKKAKTIPFTIFLIFILSSIIKLKNSIKTLLLFA